MLFVFQIPQSESNLELYLKLSELSFCGEARAKVWLITAFSRCLVFSNFSFLTLALTFPSVPSRTVWLSGECLDEFRVFLVVTNTDTRGWPLIHEGRPFPPSVCRADSAWSLKERLHPDFNCTTRKCTHLQSPCQQLRGLLALCALRFCWWLSPRLKEQVAAAVEYPPRCLFQATRQPSFIHLLSTC